MKNNLINFFKNLSSPRRNINPPLHKIYQARKKDGQGQRMNNGFRLVNLSLIMQKCSVDYLHTKMDITDAKIIEQVIFDHYIYYIIMRVSLSVCL